MEHLGPVRARTPLHPSFGRVMRLLTTSIASSIGMTFDRVEDVALATNEAFGLLVRSPGADAVHCVVSPADRAVTVTLSAESTSISSCNGEAWEDELAIRVLRGVSEEVEYAPGRISFCVRG